MSKVELFACFLEPPNSSRATSKPKANPLLGLSTHSLPSDPFFFCSGRVRRLESKKRRSHNRAATTRRTPHTRGRSGTPRQNHAHEHTHTPSPPRPNNRLTEPTSGRLSRAAPRAGRRRQTGQAHRSPLWPPPCALQRSRAASRKSATSARSTSSRRTPPRSTCCT